MNRILNTALLSTLLCLGGCSKSTDDGSDSGKNGADSGKNGADSGGMGGGPCGESGICNLTVEDAKLIDCESDSGTTPEIIATMSADGKLEVTHLAAATGCCPEFSVDAELNLRDGALRAEYTFANDFCDCVCALDVSYTVSGIPEHVDFIFYANGAQADVN